MTLVDEETLVAFLFQYRKRYEVYCNAWFEYLPKRLCKSFNTASGMRSIAIDLCAYLGRDKKHVSIPQAV